MSAPQTNLENQKRRHRGPLMGMALVVIFAVGLIFIWLMDESSGGETPGDEGGTAQDAAAGITDPEIETAPVN